MNRKYNSFMLILLVGILLLPLVSQSQIQTPKEIISSSPHFSEGIRIQANDSDLILPDDGFPWINRSAPCVIDWNEDGNKDLLVGSYLSSHIYLYLNYGDNNTPVFKEGVKLQADGSDISVTIPGGK